MESSEGLPSYLIFLTFACDDPLIVDYSASGPSSTGWPYFTNVSLGGPSFKSIFACSLIYLRMTT
jgi:hypothetical protein